MSGKAKFRLFLLAALLGLSGYILFLMFQLRDPQTPAKAGKTLYQEGQALEKQGKYEAAALAYDRSNIHLEHAINRLHSPLNGLPKEEVEAMAGECLYLRALAIRDKYFAKALAAGHPIPETRDSSTGQMFRNILQIPDPKDRDEAAANIRVAGFHFLKKDYNVHVESLRLELMSSPPQWQAIERSCKAILETKPNDVRAKYLLAKYDFEQPQLVSNMPTPSKGRSLERVNQALEYIDDVRNARPDPDNPNFQFPVWRTQFLRAQIHGWLLWYYETEKRNERKAFEQLNVLDTMLLDELVGAVAEIKKGKHLNDLSRWDVDAVLGLHVAAVDVALTKLRKNKELVDDGLLGRILEHTLDFSKAKLEAKDPAFPPRSLISTILTVMTEGQSVLAVQGLNKKQWLAGIETLRPLLKEEERAERLDPAHTADFAGILMREAYLNRKNKDDRIRNKYRDEARAWLDTGLKYGKSHNFDNDRMLPFYLKAANVVYFAASPRVEFEPYLHALQESRSPRAQATALVLDAAYDEIEGRLEKAHFKLEQALKIRDGEEGLRVHAALANVYMAMGRPENALVALSNLEHVFDRWSELNNAEKEWMAQFLRSPEEFYAMLLQCNLENAKKNIARFMRLNPRAKIFPRELVKAFEDRALDIAARELPRQNAAGFRARINLINYWIATHRLKLAVIAYDDLAKDYADRFEMLSLKIGIMQETAKASGDPQKLRSLRDETDKAFKGYIDSHRGQNRVAAQLYFSTYLAHTNRVDEALAYLREISDGELTPALRKMVIAIILAHNRGAQAVRLLQHLPNDASLDAITISWAGDIDKAHENIHAALARHETVALGRLMHAEDTFAKGDFAKAADEFAKLLDFTRSKSVAQKGVTKSMFALANKDPQKASDLLVSMLTEYPREPVMLLSAAYIYLINDNIGHDTDDFNVTRNMGSALNMWEKLVTDQGVATLTEVPLTRAEFWFLANRPDTARAELERAIANDSQNAGVLLASIMMTLEDPSREPHKDLRKYTDDLRKLMPDAATSHHIAARVEEFLRNPAAAISIYEAMLPKFPRDRVSYIHLVDLLDSTGEYDRALNWAKTWRKEMPMDLQSITAEVRFLARKKDLPAARAAATLFVEETNKRAVKAVDEMEKRAQMAAAKAAEKVKDKVEKNKDDQAKDDKLRAERRKMILDDAHYIAEIEAARGFYLGGAYDECLGRLSRMPERYQKGRVARELMGEIYIKKGEYDKAEAIFAEMFKSNRNDLQAVNNYAYVLSEYQKQPEKAREIMLETLKGRNQAISLGRAERLPPDLMATVGTIYVKLSEQKKDSERTPAEKDAQRTLAKEMHDFFKVAKERYPNDPRVYYYLGRAWEMKGEWEDAQKNFSTALAKTKGSIVLDEPQRNAVVSAIEQSQKRVHQKSRQPKEI